MNVLPLRPPSTKPPIRVPLLLSLITLAFTLSACILSDSDDGPELGDGGTITVGQTVTGMITEEKYGWTYRFTLTEEKSVTITMEATQGYLDPYIELKDSGGNMLEWDDDDGGGVTAEVRRTLQPGTYTIVAKAYEGDMITEDAIGGFALTLAVDAVSTGGTIAIGGSVTNTISAAAYAWRYTLTVPATATLTISMQALSGDLDAYLEVYDSQNSLVTWDDDNGTGSDALIQIQFTPGTYTILATRYDEEYGSSTGAFLLSVTQ